MVGKDVGKTKYFTLSISVLLDTLEVATFRRRSVANVCLLLFVNLTRVHNLLDCPERYKAENLNIASLADTIGSILGLKVIRRIPVRINNNNFIRRCDVESHAASFG